MKKTICFIFLIAFTGCSYTAYIPVSSTIPPRMQQQINTSSNKTISFQFTGNPKAELIKVQPNSVTNTYKIDKPFKSLYRELVKTKFLQIKPNSKNKINVTIKDFNTTTKRTYHKISMTVTVQLQDGSRTDKRTFSYETGVEYEPGLGITFLPSEPIDNLLLKFIVASAKYIDTFYGIK